MERRTELKRGEPIKRSAPEKIRAWKDRTAKHLPRASKERKQKERERTAFRAFVLKHRPRCEARLPMVCSGRSTEVNELQRGSGREDCWLDYDKVTALCSACHRWITLNPQWAKHHGHQIEVGRVNEEHAFNVGAVLRQRFLMLPCKPTCPVDHREEYAA